MTVNSVVIPDGPGLAPGAGRDRAVGARSLILTCVRMTVGRNGKIPSS